MGLQRITCTPEVSASNSCLLADLEEVIAEWTNNIFNTWNIQFKITDDHGNISYVQEVYSPIDFKIFIYDIYELLRSYFDLSDHPGLVGFGTTGLKSLADSRNVRWEIDYVQPSSTLQDLGIYYVAYTNAPSGFLHSGTGESGIGSRFLSRCNLRTVTDAQPCAVSFFGHGETLKVKLLHYVGGIPQLTEVVSNDEIPATNNMQTYNFTLAALATAAEIDVKDIIYADVQMFLNSAPMDSVRFMREPYHRVMERTFAFIGAMGEPEFVVLSGKEQREQEYDGVFLMEHKNYRKADTTLRQLHSSYTGALSEEERMLIWDMAASPWVYVIENGQLREVTIIEAELTDSLPHREPIGYRIKWRFADEMRQRTFDRVPNTLNMTPINNEDTIEGLE